MSEFEHGKRTQCECQTQAVAPLWRTRDRFGQVLSSFHNLIVQIAVRAHEERGKRLKSAEVEKVAHSIQIHNAETDQRHRLSQSSLWCWRSRAKRHLFDTHVK